jgi:hypothetical protein
VFVEVPEEAVAMVDQSGVEGYLDEDGEFVPLEWEDLGS